MLASQLIASLLLVPPSLLILTPATVRYRGSYEFETSSEGETRQRGLHVSLQWDCMLAGSTGARYSRTKEYPLP